MCGEDFLLCAAHYTCTTKSPRIFFSMNVAKIIYVGLRPEDAWIWAVHLELTGMKEVLTYIFHTPPSSLSVRPQEVQKAPQTSPRNRPWAWWPLTFDELHNSLAICYGDCIAQFETILYARISRPCSIRPDRRWAFLVLPLCSSQKQRGSDNLVYWILPKSSANQPNS